MYNGDLQQQLKLLLDKEEWNEAERLWMLTLYESRDGDLIRQMLYRDFQDQIGRASEQPQRAMAEQVLERIRIRLSLPTTEIPERNTIGKRYTWLSYAAAVLLLVLGFAFFFQQQIKPSLSAVPVAAKDLTPGGNKAVLTLADGTVVMLDNATGTDTLAAQGEVNIVRTAAGKISYQGTDGGAGNLVNIISTPRGGQFQLTLSDGTRVWLNATSSLKYPVAFSGPERAVEISGEAYFEVASNGKPFRVKIDDRAEVLVTGTHFNINAYADESAVRTTLVEGAVSVSNASGKLDIKPGQQAAVSATGMVLKQQADLEEILAWKNGRFEFGDNTDIRTIMRQVARWYDVDVEYRGNVQARIGGSVSRSVNASKLFEILEMTGAVQFRIEGKKVTVSQR